VFLAGPYAYKLKKPVNLGFLDFSTLERRRHFCDEEVRLNRRLAPRVYLGVVPVTEEAGRPRVEGAGEAVDWLVKMVRLPEEASLRDRVTRGEVTEADLRRVGRFIAEFHRTAAAGPEVAAFGRFEVVAGNARENFTQAEPHVGATLSRAVFDRLRALTERHLQGLRPAIEDRAARGVPRDTHGDLRLDHVYLHEGDLFAIDCIEFNERFRYADPVADVAFLVMDMKSHGRPDLAAALAEEYFAAENDGGRELLPFYTAYRAAVRGKVGGMKATEPEVPDDEKAAAADRAKAHWLLALAELEEPAGRPALVLVGGLPGTGKSTLARGVADAAGFAVVRSDVVRKELAGVDPQLRVGSEYYSGEWTGRTYAECLRRAEAGLWEGRRVIVDATFRQDAQRAAFLELARKLRVAAVMLVCEARPEVVRERLDRRTGDASDATWAVYRAVAWEPIPAAAGRQVVPIATDGTADPVAAAVTALRDRGLAG
jgi:aminoglycoside phosphotransferase family enzyme/predicted kinase